jgi:hypothetical protein
MVRLAFDSKAPKPNGLDADPAITFPLTPFADIKLNTDERNYLVKELLTSTGIAVVWGPPKSGKSFWVMDVALHIALGWEYRGRKVQQASAVYIGLEGRNGIPARVEAFKIKHSVSEAPFYLITHPVNLIADADALVASIKSQMGDSKPGVVVIDTLNRSLVGSESKDEDMSAYIAAAGKIEEQFGCLVIIVHHCGIDATRPRGHTSLTGAVEVQIAIKKSSDGIVGATVERAKDIEEGAEIFSRLEKITVGTDPDGDDITSLVIVPTEGSPLANKKLSGAHQRALDALCEALLDFGIVPPANNHIPRQTRTISVVRWREVFEAKTVVSSEKPDTKRKAFVRAVERLQDLAIIGVWDDQVWVAGHAGQART